MKTYRRHNCARNHRSHATAARCIWPRAAWIAGDGPIALVAWCSTPTVTLWDDLTEALNAKHEIDSCGCGGRCTGRHDIIHLALDGDAGRAA